MQITKPLKTTTIPPPSILVFLIVLHRTETNINKIFHITKKKIPRTIKKIVRGKNVGGIPNPCLGGVCWGYTPFLFNIIVII